jgi:hypothetical protein
VLVGLGGSVGAVLWGLRLGGQLLIFWMTRQQQHVGVIEVAQSLARRRECRFALYVGRTAGAAL